VNGAMIAPGSGGPTALLTADNSGGSEYGQFRRQAQRCAPCGCARLATSICSAVVLALIAAVYIPLVIHNRVPFGFIAFLDMAIFHGLLCLLLVSYFQTMFTDSGTTPQSWHESITNAPEHVQNEFKMCPKTNMYRPPRSHYDSMTRRFAP
jgi:hypothetical protein